ncbi:unnamed protein product [Cuscuta epithymum]|uniref:Uncharacterized protein n=1 Tax=Cuscuta epithymum TaxID=186058 RepID=A0AAV0F1Q3_9ASTE|nr:unnamed protein product [Cuscuta epithymum]
MNGTEVVADKCNGLSVSFPPLIFWSKLLSTFLLLLSLSPSTKDPSSFHGRRVHLILTSMYHCPEKPIGGPSLRAGNQILAQMGLFTRKVPTEV